MHQSTPQYVYAYCHGFLSGPASFTGVELKKQLADKRVDLELLNLNGGDDPGGISFSGGVEVVRTLFEDKKQVLGDGIKLRLIGSSLGGYVVARYAELYPDQVDRIFMLCPSFNLASRWSKFYSEEYLRTWEKDGARDFVLPGDVGGTTSIPWSFVEDGLSQPAFPAYTCPAFIVHGLGDTTVPSDTTRRLVEEMPAQGKKTTAMFVEDGHSLTLPKTMSLTSKAMFEFFEIGGAAGDGDEGVGASEKSTVEVERKFPAHGLDKLKVRGHINTP
ncbi:unnamed protein product [Choristocarpus tenellus]